MTIPTTKRTWIRSNADVVRAVQKAAETHVISLDTEGTGLDPYSSKLRLVQLTIGDESFALDCFRFDPRNLNPILKARKRWLVIQNVSHDARQLWHAGVQLDGEIWDTLLASQVKARGDRSIQHKLGMIVERELGVHIDKESALSDWSVPEFSSEQVDYAFRDAEVLIPIQRLQYEWLKQHGLLFTAGLEFRAALPLAEMTYFGVPIDIEQWMELHRTAVTKRDAFQQQLDEMADCYDLFGQTGWFNWNSPHEVLRLLQDRGLNLTATKADALAWFKDDDPLVPVILDYREQQTLISKFGEEWLHAALNKYTQRIHGSYFQIGAATGRTACGDPNLQQIPSLTIDGYKVYRRPFIPPIDYRWIKADFSQIELRIMAELANERKMIEAYATGQDLHKLTASVIQAKDIADVTSADRQIAKSANFGLIYGAGVPRFMDYCLSNFHIKLEEKQARDIRYKFFNVMYPGLKAHHQSIGQNDEPEYVKTLGGREILARSFTEKVNYPDQGTGADMLKAALGALWKERDEKFPDVEFAMNVHDEISIFAPEDQAEEAAEWLQQTMTREAQRFLQKVPVETEVTIGPNWSGK